MGRREGRRNRHSSYTTQQVALPLKQPRLTSDPPRFSPRTKCERLGGDSHASHQSGRGHQNDQDYADCKDDDEGQQLLHLDAGAGADVDDDDDDDGDDDDDEDDDQQRRLSPCAYVAIVLTRFLTSTIAFDALLCNDASCLDLGISLKSSARHPWSLIAAVCALLGLHM